MTREQIVVTIQTLNHGATEEFLEQFETLELYAYLRRLASVRGVCVPPSQLQKAG